MNPTPIPDQVPTTSQPNEHTPPTPPSITTSITELGEHLQEKNADDETTAPATEEPAA
jgi:hypothetical protein